MCSPQMIAGGLQAGVGAMGSIAKYNADVEDFNAGEDRWQENYKLANQSARDEQNQITAKSIQMQTQTSQKAQAYSQAGAVAAAEAETSAAGAGVTGATVDEVITNIQRGAAQNRHYLQVNANNDAIQIAHEMNKTVTDQKARIASVVRPKPPNPASAFLGIAGAIVGAL